MVETITITPCALMLFNEFDTSVFRAFWCADVKHITDCDYVCRLAREVRLSWKSYHCS